MDSTFTSLGVPTPIIDALAKRGITEPFEIQAATIADSLAGRDVCGRAPTGSGKTLAFGVPLVANLMSERPSKPGHPSALVLAPTRELAEQIMTELNTFAGKLRVAAVYGGVGFGKQLDALRRGVDILVACPGRLVDLIERGEVTLSHVTHVVLDEADRMADMGFLPVVRRLLDQTADDRQTVLFSATLDGDVATLTKHYQHNPVRHEVGEETPDISAATHLFWETTRPERNQAVAEIVNAAWPTVIFVRTRHGADRLARQLGKLDIKAAAIHGNRSQNQRQRALDEFTNNRVHALVATDVAARGIHVDGVSSVIHYDPPNDHKDYIHRSGRTARAGADGVVVTLVQPDQRRDVGKLARKAGIDPDFTAPAIERINGIESPELRAASPEPAGDRSAAPKKGSGKGRGRGGRNRRGRSGSGNGQNTSSQSRGRNRRGSGKGRSDNRQHGAGRSGSNSSKSGRSRHSGSRQQSTRSGR